MKTQTLLNLVQTEPLLSQIFTGLVVAILVSLMYFILQVPMKHFKIKEKSKSYYVQFLKYIVRKITGKCMDKDVSETMIPDVEERIEQAETALKQLKVALKAIAKEEPQSDIPEIPKQKKIDRGDKH